MRLLTLLAVAWAFNFQVTRTVRVKRRSSPFTSLISTTLHLVMKDQADKVASMFKEKGSNIGKEVTVRDLALMSVEMVNVVEPDVSDTVLYKFLADESVQTAGKVWFAIKKLPPRWWTTQEKIAEQAEKFKPVVDELIGLYIVLNESDTAMIEVLLSAPQCLLSNEDELLQKMTDPCRDIGKKAFEKIIDRYLKVMGMDKDTRGALKISSEWNSRSRQVVARLDTFSGILDSDLSPKWTKIKNFFLSKQII